MLKSTFAACIGLCLISCVSVRMDSHALPELAAINCCWLVQEKIEIIDTAGSHHLAAALAIESGVHTLVVFDSLGSKILASQRRIGSISIDMDKSDGRIPVDLLWMAINLVHAPLGSWAKTNQHWRIEDNGGERVLRRDNDVWAQARVGRLGDGLTDADIYFPARKLKLKVQGIERRAL